MHGFFYFWFNQFLTMKLISLTFSFLVILTYSSCTDSSKESVNANLINNPLNADGTIDTVNIPVMSFDNEAYNFGEIAQGEKVFHAFSFENTGKTDLIITSATATCGCTVPKWPKKPIKPGEKASIEVIFDSEHKNGQQNKQVTIIANTYPSTNMVAVQGMVIAPKTQD